MQLVGDYEAAITDLDDQQHTFRVTVSDGPNEALKTQYGLKNQLVMLGFEPCGIAYRSPQELLDNGWAATDEEANAKRGDDRCISKPGSKVQLWVIPTNEELVIARDTRDIVSAL